MSFMQLRIKSKKQILTSLYYLWYFSMKFGKGSRRPTIYQKFWSKLQVAVTLRNEMQINYRYQYSFFCLFCLMVFLRHGGGGFKKCPKQFRHLLWTAPYGNGFFGNVYLSAGKQYKVNFACTPLT